MAWKDAYRRHLRKKGGQNEVAMEFANSCRGLLEGKYLIETTSIQLVNDEYARIGFRIGSMSSGLIVYINESGPRWVLDAGGGSLYDGHDYNIDEFQTQIERLLSEHIGIPGGVEDEDVELPPFDAPEVWNVTPVGLMKGQARK